MQLVNNHEFKKYALMAGAVAAAVALRALAGAVAIRARKFGAHGGLFAPHATLVFRVHGRYFVRNFYFYACDHAIRSARHYEPDARTFGADTPASANIFGCVKHTCVIDPAAQSLLPLFYFAARV